MYNYRTLEDTGLELVHEAFIKGFSDYQIKMEMPLWKFKQMLKRRGYAPDKSMGVFDAEAMVGFIINGFREWNGKLTAYDAGTAVIPEYRKQRLTTNMFLKLADRLKSLGARQYLLEVLQQNTSALELYKKQGFEITRSFDCFRIMKNNYVRKGDLSVEIVDCFTAEEWEQVKNFWDYQPSWQNSIDSVCALQEVFKYCFVRIDNRIAGYGIVEINTGDIPQLAVDRSFRRRGIATAVLSGLAEASISDKLVFLNVEDSNTEMKDFLKAAGFENFVNQYEMLLMIDN